MALWGNHMSMSTREFNFRLNNYQNIEVTDFLRCSDASYKMTLSPAIAFPSGHGSTTTERSGAYSRSAYSALANLYLDSFLPYKIGGAKVRLDSITIYIDSTENDAHIAAIWIATYDSTDGSYNGVYKSTETIGNGNATYDDESYDIGYVMKENLRHNLRIDVYIDTGDAGDTVSIHAIEFKFSTVDPNQYADGDGEQSGLGDLGGSPSGPVGGLGQ